MIIYKITNLLNNKVYVGQTTKALDERWKQHKRNIREGRKYHLYNAIRKYGIDNFKVEVIDKAESFIDLSLKEIFWIQFYNTTNRKFGYNDTFGGEGGIPTKETRLKISKSRKGISPKEGTGKKISIALKDYWKNHIKEGPSLEIRNQIAETLKRKGCKPPLHKMTGKNHPMFGKHHSDESKKLMSLGQTGIKRHSEEEKQKRSVQWLKEGNPNYVVIDEDKFITLIKQGLYIKDLAKALKISKPTVFHKLKEFFGVSSLVKVRKLL